MNNINSNWLRNLIIGKPDEDHSTVYRNLLNLIQTPAVLIDNNRGIILYANSEFNKLTAYSLSDYEKMSIDDLFDIELINNLQPVEQISIELKRHKREKILCYAWKNFIDDSGQFIVVTFVSEQQFIEQQQKWQENLFNVTKKLLRLIEKDTIEEAFHDAVMIIGEFFNTDHVLIYQAKSEYPVLELIVKNNLDFEFSRNHTFQ